MSNAIILERLPYLGLDLEEIAEEYVRVEYNPNRPDFSTDYGIARALNGLLGLETGAPEYRVRKGSLKILVDSSVRSVRPYIGGVVVRQIKFDDETLRQIISMQEDLHNGIGRKRRKVAIGLHNFDVVRPPIKYGTAGGEFRFIPLGDNSAISIKEILRNTEQGRHYSALLSQFNRYPILTDSMGNVLSFPPIINGELTRVTDSTTNLFVDVTGTEMKTVEDSLSILSAALQDAGGHLESVEVLYGKKRMRTPDLNPIGISLDLGYARKLLGLDLTSRNAVQCLARSRITARPLKDKIHALLPRYRIDILHEVDLVEDIAIGFGLDKIQPTIPRSNLIGSFDKQLTHLALMRETLTSLGFTEVMNFSLVSKQLLRDSKTQDEEVRLSVDNPKTTEHEVLRPRILPSLLAVLSRNIHEEYPQRVFEIAKVFLRDESPVVVSESFHLGFSIAHGQANYSEAKSYLASALSGALGIECKTLPKDDPMFIEGRGAEIRVREQAVGVLGEISPSVLQSFALRTPVSACELDLTKLLR